MAVHKSGDWIHPDGFPTAAAKAERPHRDSFMIPFEGDVPQLTDAQLAIIKDMGDTVQILPKPASADPLIKRFLDVAGLPDNPEAAATYAEFRKATPEGTMKAFIDFVAAKHSKAAEGTMVSGSTAAEK